VLTKDRRLRHRRREIAAIRRHRVQAFCLTSGNLRAAEQARRFIDNAERIDAACAEAGPFVYAVHANRIVRIFPS
jgi:PIN domain-containing protein